MTFCFRLSAFYTAKYRIRYTKAILQATSTHKSKHASRKHQIIRLWKISLYFFLFVCLYLFHYTWRLSFQWWIDFILLQLIAVYLHETHLSRSLMRFQRRILITRIATTAVDHTRSITGPWQFQQSKSIGLGSGVRPTTLVCGQHVSEVNYLSRLLPLLPRCQRQLHLT